MALAIDRKKTALLVMDCENDLVHPEGKLAKAMGYGAMIEKHGTIGHIRRVQDAARAAGLPVIFIKIGLDKMKPEEMPKRGQFFKALPNIGGMALIKGSWGAEIHDDLKPAPDEEVIYKCPVSAFSRSTLDETLKKLGVTDLILTGVATNMVVEGTARDAADRGYGVITVEDGVMTFSEEVHQASLVILRTVGDVAPAAEIAAELGG